MSEDDLKIAAQAKKTGNQHYVKGEWEEALKWYTTAVTLDKKNKVYPSNRSACYANMKNFEKALEDGELCIALDEAWPKGYVRKGAALVGLGRIDDARDAYEVALALDPDNAAAQKGMANLPQTIDKDKLAEMAQEAGKKMPGMSNIINALGSNPEILELLKDPDTLTKFMDIQKNPGNAMQYMADPKFAKLLEIAMSTKNSMGTPQQQPNASDETKMDVEKPKEEEEVKIEPEIIVREPTELTNEQKAAEIKKEAVKLHSKRKFKAAIAKFEEASELSPNDASLISNRGACVMILKKYDEAIKIYLEALDVLKEHDKRNFKLKGKMLSKIADCYTRKEDWEQATKYYQMSLLEDRDFKVVTKERDMLRKKKKAESLAYIDPKKSDEERLKGNKEFVAGNFKEAIELYTEAIKRDPKNFKAFGNRAACYIKVMGWGRALEDCDSCLAINPQFVKAYLRKAKVQHFLKQYKKAIDTYNECLKIQPDLAEAHKGKAETMRAVNAGNNSEEFDQQRRQQALQDPEIQAILTDPKIKSLLQNPQELQNAMRKDPKVASAVEKLYQAGLIKTG